VAPRYARPHYALGLLHSQEGRADAAAECLSNAARLAAAIKDDDQNEQQQQEEESSGSGSVTSATGVEIDAPPVPVAVGVADDEVAYNEFGCLLELGKVRLEQGRHSAAAKVFETALKINPTSAAGWNALGTARAKLNDPDTIAAFETALQCNPKSADALYGLGATLLDQASNKNEKAIAMKHIERAAEIDPMHAKALARLAANAVGGEYLSRVRSF
jgi:tetratricopeptide (TPR) repeat protein